MLKNAIILGGSGQAGMLLTQSLIASGVAVTEVDLHAPPGKRAEATYIQADATNYGNELRNAIREAECVCICLPERVALDAAPAIAANMRHGTLWLDTLSVKGPILHVLEAHAAHLEVLSINPMFAPALGWRGHAVAAAEHGQIGPKASAFKALLMEWGASVKMMTAEEHDRLTAALQAATHAAVLAFGSVLLDLNYDASTAWEVATPPHRILLGLLYRMISQNPEVYWDIQAYHPQGADVRRNLAVSIEHIQSMAERDDSGQFERLFQNLRSLLAPRQEELARLSHDLVETVRPKP